MQARAPAADALVLFGRPSQGTCPQQKREREREGKQKKERATELQPLRLFSGTEVWQLVS